MATGNTTQILERSMLERNVLTLGTEWMSELHQANSMQDLGDTGSVFGSTRMTFETLESKIADGLMKMMTREEKAPDVDKEDR